MNLLAIDTSTNYLSIGISTNEKRFIFHQCVGQKHAEKLLPKLKELLSQADIKLSNLDAIVYGKGPGSFTGLRIAASVAQGLAFAHRKPLIGIQTLDAIAEQATKTTQLIVALDARMQQVYCACYDTSDQIQRTSDIKLLNPEQINVNGKAWAAAGNGFSIYKDRIPTTLKSQINEYLPELLPHANAYLNLAYTPAYQAQKSNYVDLLYVRNKVALTVTEQKAYKI